MSSYQYQPTGSSENMNPEKPYAPAKKSRKTMWIIIGAIVAAAVILGAVLGGVFGSRAANNNSENRSAVADSANESASSARSSGAGTGAGTGSMTGGGAAAASSTVASATSASASATPSAPAAGTYAVEPRPAWDWSKDKAIGMSLGNWLILERWMSEDWFIGIAGPDSWDEWDFSRTLGQERTLEVLQEHWDTWITEDDLQLMFEHGINHLRIPTGYWAWIPTTGDEPYLNNTAVYQAQIDKVLGWAYARGMYVVLDLHGLPGSQNGEQASGHNTTTPAWFNNPVNMGRSDASVAAVAEYISNSPFRTIISGIQPINEPRPYTSDQTNELRDYYTRGYETIQASSWPVPLFIHDGYANGGLAGDYWRNYAAQYSTTPPSMVFEDHPYPGNFPPTTVPEPILDQVCEGAERGLGLTIPYVITEFSLYTGVKDAAFETEFYESQVATWGWSGGSMYWSYRHIPSQMQLQAGLDYSQYSFVTLVRNGSATIPTPAMFGLANTSTRANAIAFLANLDTHCGAAPNNVAPFPAPTNVWTLEEEARAASETYTATSAVQTSAAASATARVRRNLLKRSWQA